MTHGDSLADLDGRRREYIVRAANAQTPAEILRAAGIRPADVRASLPEPVPDRTWYRWLHQATGGGHAGMLFRVLCHALTDRPPASATAAAAPPPAAGRPDAGNAARAARAGARRRP